MLKSGVDVSSLFRRDLSRIFCVGVAVKKSVAVKPEPRVSGGLAVQVAAQEGDVGKPEEEEKQLK
jgi:hypothetical protein